MALWTRSDLGAEGLQPSEQYVLGHAGSLACHQKHQLLPLLGIQQVHVELVMNKAEKPTALMGISILGKEGQLVSN